MAERVECVVVGAGVVGLAAARALTLAGREVVILEATDTIGTGISSRNSEVIHAGIYYPTGSLKARLCVEGKQQLYAYCESRGIPHRRLGKLIVAADDEQMTTLLKIRAQAAANGVTDLVLLDRAEVERLEPALACAAALLSPSTGIVDSHALMLSFLGEAEASGAMIAFNTPVLGGRVEQDGILLRAGGAEPMELRCRVLVNAAGLHAQEVAHSIEGLDPATVPPMHYAKGNYFRLAGRSPFSRLIYPVPEAAGLGIHLTLDLGGEARFGPDVEWVDSLNYDVTASRLGAFEAAIRTYFPALGDAALAPAYTGIRPKLGPAGTPAADFLIQGPDAHRVPGLINLYGIESPGLTASLAIADVVVSMLHEAAQQGPPAQGERVG